MITSIGESQVFAMRLLQTDKTVEERLDMAMARTEWLQIFPNHKFITIATMLYCK